MLHPNQFQVDDAWIAFQLNDDPICTVQDGEFNCLCLMDAASCFILSTAFVGTSEPGSSELEIRRLFKAAFAQKKMLPARLFLPTSGFENALRAEAKRQRISVVSAKEAELRAFTSEARQGFRQHLQLRR